MIGRLPNVDRVKLARPEVDGNLETCRRRHQGRLLQNPWPPSHDAPGLLPELKSSPSLSHEEGYQARLEPRVALMLVARYSHVAGQDCPSAFGSQGIDPFNVGYVTLE